MLIIRPLELREANILISKWHRHHKPVIGHRFSIGVYDTTRKVFVGAAVVGRPVARKINYKEVVEVTRLVTDGTKNACSILYAATARAAKEMGYIKIQTYILENELGTSLIASGWKLENAICGGGDGWHSREGRRHDQPICKKQKWIKELNINNEKIVYPHSTEEVEIQPRLL